MDITKEIVNLSNIVDENLKNVLSEKFPNKLYEAMNYSIFAGGKRLRPVLLLGAFKSFSDDYKKAIPFALAIEMIHTYSLIHDDLPALDNDDLRRGMPSSHVKFGEALAILAGDCLLNKAYEVMANACLENKDTTSVEAMAFIAKAAGDLGMIGGQVVDMGFDSLENKSNTLDYIHENKTGALILASLKAGAILGGCEKEMDLIEKGGFYLGKAFQIKDDILNVTSTREQLGKSVGSDVENDKLTYVSLYGLNKAEQEYIYLSDCAVSCFEKLPKPFLWEYSKMVFNRKN